MPVSSSFRTFLAVFGVTACLAKADDGPFRPPAVPLATSDPYLSIWLMGDQLTSDVTRHWTNEPQALSSLIRIDGKAYRLMGKDPQDVPAFPQKRVTVTPTRSVFVFGDGHVQVTLTFMTPMLPGDLDIFSRPVTYLTWAVSASDGATHSVELFDSTSTALAVDDRSRR